MRGILILLSACVIGLAFSADLELCNAKTGTAKAAWEKLGGCYGL